MFMCLITVYLMTKKLRLGKLIDEGDVSNNVCKKLSSLDFDSWN